MEQTLETYLIEEILECYYETMQEKLETYLEASLTKQKKNGEVFTPLWMVKEMLETLDSAFWTNKDLKILDPCVGIGQFPVILVEKLMVGLSEVILDETERKKHILENMIYAIDIDEENLIKYKNVMGYSTNFNDKNVLLGSALEDPFPDVHFDLVIGNPPYNQPFTARFAKPLYNVFIQKFIDRTDKMLFIVPSRWFSGGYRLDEFRGEMLKRKDIKFIKHFENASDVFGKSVQISGGVNYFLIDKSYNGLCDFNGELIDNSRHDILIGNEFNELIELLKNKRSINELYLPTSVYNIVSNDKRLLNEPETDTYRCFVSKLKGSVKYIKKEHVRITDRVNNWKVLTTRSQGNVGSGFGNTFIATPDDVYSQSYFSFAVGNNKEADSLLSYLKCKLPNVMLSLRKSSQHTTTQPLKWVPLVPLDRIWDDDEVYKYFNLTEEMIQKVENKKLKK